MRKSSCLDFDCKVRHFFLNTRCTSMTCSIVKSVKKIKDFYTHWEVFCHSAVLPPNWNNPYKCGQKCGQIPSVPPYYQYFISLFSRCLYINVEMNRHGSSFGSNNCSKRVVISVFSDFLVVDLGGFSEVHPQGMRPFWECPNPLFLAPHPLFWAPHPLFWGGKSPHFSTFFVFFYIDFVFFFMNFAYFPIFLSNFLLEQTQIGRFRE